MDYSTLYNRFPDLCQRYYPRLDRIKNLERLFFSIDKDEAITEDEIAALWAYAINYIHYNGPINEHNFYHWTYKYCDHCEMMVSTHIDNGMGNGEHYHCDNCGLPQDSINECGSGSECGCCECFHCDNCDPCHENGCHECGNCDSHCDCNHCNECNDNYSNNDFCSDCEYCNGCCSCNEDVDEDYSADSLKHFIPTVKTRKGFSCTRLVGVEWEYNSCDNSSSPLKEWSTRWNGAIQEDGSCGMEIVTPPLGGDYIRLALTELASAFKKSDAKVNDTCGIHVHVDARDLKWDDMYRLLKVYAKVEPLLYLIAGQQRINNTYCLPCGKEFMGAFNSAYGISVNDGRGASKASKDERKKNLADLKVSIMRFPLGFSDDRDGRRAITETKQYHRHNRAKKASGRYRGMNIAPWVAGRMHGHGSKIKRDATIEFRIHRNSLDAERVIGWAQLCAKMVDWAANSSNKELENLPKSQLRTLIAIAPELKKFILKRITDWRRATSYGAHNTDEGVSRRLTFKSGKFLFKESPRYNYVE